LADGYNQKIHKNVRKNNCQIRMIEHTAEGGFEIVAME
jgi:hypothetical protein